MDIHTATEEAYKKGYEDGKRDAVVHGKWITKDGITYCSECREHAQVYNLFVCDGDKWIPMWKFNHCPNCGAKMDL